MIECVDWREQYGDQTEAIMQENAELKAFCSILVKVINPQYKMLAATRLYQNWQLNLLQAEAAGIPINKQWAEETTQKIEKVLGIQNFDLTR